MTERERERERESDSDSKGEGDGRGLPWSCGLRDGHRRLCLEQINNLQHHKSGNYKDGSHPRFRPFPVINSIRSQMKESEAEPVAQIGESFTHRSSRAPFGPTARSFTDRRQRRVLWAVLGELPHSMAGLWQLSIAGAGGLGGPWSSPVGQASEVIS